MPPPKMHICSNWFKTWRYYYEGDAVWGVTLEPLHLHKRGQHGDGQQIRNI